MSDQKNADPTTRPLVRLESRPHGARLVVERTFPGRIRNVSILTTGPALGHGFTIDATTVEQVARHAEGIRGRWTHGNLCEDGLGRHLGTWRDLRVETFQLCRGCELEAPAGSLTTCPSCQGPTSEECRAVGDFLFAASAHKLRPDGLDVPAPVYLMDRALEDPRSLGISIVAHLGYEERKREGQEPERLARLAAKQDLKRGDWVADPAANPVGLEAGGLHAGTHAPSAVVELATRELDRLVARQGREGAKLRALGFLARYFKDDVAAEGELERLEAQVEALESQVAELQATVKTHREQEQAAFLERLRRETAALQAPVPETDVERVAGLLRAGQTEAAQALADAFLSRAKVQSQLASPPDRAPPVLAPGDAPRPPESNTAHVQAHALRRRGWTVVMSADGTQIEHASLNRKESRP